MKVAVLQNKQTQEFAYIDFPGLQYCDVKDVDNATLLRERDVAGMEGGVSWFPVDDYEVLWL